MHTVPMRELATYLTTDRCTRLRPTPPRLAHGIAICADAVPAYSMSDQCGLQKGGKLMQRYARVIHGDSRCGIDLSRDST